MFPSSKRFFNFFFLLVIIRCKAECPSTPDDGCSVCGPGECVSSPAAIFALSGFPSVPCGELEEAGYGGQVPLSQCGFLPMLIGDLCNCNPVGPTEAPIDPTQAPVDPIEAPVDPTEAPVDPTQAPVDPTQAPVLILTKKAKKSKSLKSAAPAPVKSPKKK
jgi:hypothetical protein